MSKNTSAPAFPIAESHGIATDFPWTQGISMRDYFAARAIDMAAMDDEVSPRYGEKMSYRGIAERAYLMADSMLSAREK